MKHKKGMYSPEGRICVVVSSQRLTHAALIYLLGTEGEGHRWRSILGRLLVIALADDDMRQLGVLALCYGLFLLPAALHHPSLTLAPASSEVQHYNLNDSFDKECSSAKAAMPESLHIKHVHICGIDVQSDWMPQLDRLRDT